jgi:hypothetical protein
VTGFVVTVISPSGFFLQAANTIAKHNNATNPLIVLILLFISLCFSSDKYVLRVQVTLFQAQK